MKSTLHLSKQAAVLLTASSCCTDIKISRTNPPVKGFPLRTVGGGRTGLGELYEEGTMQEVIVMHGEEGKRTIFFLLPTLYSFSGVLVSFDFLFGFLLCKRRTCRQAMRLRKRIVTASGKCLCECQSGRTALRSCAKQGTRQSPKQPMTDDRGLSPPHEGDGETVG